MRMFIYWIVNIESFLKFIWKIYDCYGIIIGLYLGIDIVIYFLSLVLGLFYKEINIKYWLVSKGSGFLFFSVMI